MIIIIVIFSINMADQKALLDMVEKRLEELYMEVKGGPSTSVNNEAGTGKAE